MGKKIIPGEKTTEYTTDKPEKQKEKPSSDTRSENNQAQQKLSESLPSHLKSLRTSTSGVGTQVSEMNKGVERYAQLEAQTDV